MASAGRAGREAPSPGGRRSAPPGNTAATPGNRPPAGTRRDAARRACPTPGEGDGDGFGVGRSGHDSEPWLLTGARPPGGPLRRPGATAPSRGRPPPDPSLSQPTLNAPCRWIALIPRGRRRGCRRRGGRGAGDHALWMSWGRTVSISEPTTMPTALAMRPARGPAQRGVAPGQMHRQPHGDAQKIDSSAPWLVARRQ